MITLAIFITITMVTCIISFALIWFKNQTKVNGLLFLLFLCFAMSIIVDCLRIFIIFGAKADYPEFDFFGFIVKSVTIFMSFALLGVINVVLGEYIGIIRGYSRFFPYYLFSLVLIYTCLSIFFGHRLAPMGVSDFHLYQIDLVIYVLIFFTYFPLAAFIFHRNLHILRVVTNKKIQFKLIIFTVLTTGLVAERLYSLGAYAFFNSVTGLPIEASLLLDFALITGISCLLLVDIFKYHGLVESVGIYFSVKKLYILKNSGILMFEYDFDNNRFLDPLESNAPLIGGFIYAICEGLKELLESETVSSFTSGNRSLIIQRGKYLVTVLIVTEDSILLHQKLLQFINLFETHYKKELEAWNGEITLFDQGQIQKWILETISES